MIIFLITLSSNSNAHSIFYVSNKGVSNVPHLSQNLFIDRLSLRWADPYFQALTRPPTRLGNNLSELIKDSPDWLYLSFHWSGCDQNFRENPSKIPHHIEIKIKMSNPSQEPRASSKTPNQDPDAKPKSGTSSILQSPKPGLKGHGCSLHLQNQDREPKFEPRVCQRPVTISKSRSRC